MNAEIINRDSYDGQELCLEVCNSQSLYRPISEMDMSGLDIGRREGSAEWLELDVNVRLDAINKMEKETL